MQSKRKTLYLTLYRGWFDLIASGIKKNEYREVKPYWTKRLKGKEFADVVFRNGYSLKDPEIRVEFLGINFRERVSTSYGLKIDKPVYDIKLGEILEIKNY